MNTRTNNWHVSGLETAHEMIDGDPLFSYVDAPRARQIAEALELADNRIFEADEEIDRLKEALARIKAELEDCPQPLPENGYQGRGVQDWINAAYAIACAALEPEGED